MVGTLGAGAHQPERQAWPQFPWESSAHFVPSWLHLHRLQEPGRARPSPQIPVPFGGQPVRHWVGGVESHHSGMVWLVGGQGGARVLFTRMSWMQV